MTSTSISPRAQVHAPPSYLEAVTSAAELAGLRPTANAGVALLVVTQDDPSVADRWSVESLPHLVVRLGPDWVRVGPFVQPGVTACLRCVAAAGAPAELPATYADLDRPLLMVGLAMAACDLTTWQAGRLPATWSATLTIGADLLVEPARYPRHPHCGCSWELTAPGHHHSLSSLPSIERRWVREQSSQ